jgi:hypothetical protein
MIQCGLRRGLAELINVCQSSRVLGAKILVPSGQLFFCVDLYTSRQAVHFMRTPGEYAPVTTTLVQVQPLGLPAFGVVEMAVGWQ